LQKDNFIILTGAMGAGKSTVLANLTELGYTCVAEPAREVLAEQRKIGGNGVPEKDPQLFIDLMLGKTIAEYEKLTSSKSIVIFDRAMPDFTGYADLLCVNNEKYIKASKEYRFNQNVFMFNGWREIYVNDDERKMSYELAEKFGTDVKKIYADLGYIIHDVPNVSVNERVMFIIDKLFDFTSY